MKKGKRGHLDAKKMIRTNLRHGGVPVELKHKVHHQKPKLVVICDVSTSVRPASEFMLRLVYELQDQISKARPFVFIDDIKDISEHFAANRPEIAIEVVLADIGWRGHVGLQIRSAPQRGEPVERAAILSPT